MPIIIPSISAVELPPAPVLNPEIAPFVWTAYGTLVQDYIEGRLQDTAAYFTPLAVISADLELERDKTFRKYHRARREMLAAEGRKNLSLMPGYLQRKLMDLALDEKREMSEATSKIAARYAETSLDSFYAGADSALASDALRSEMHFKIQQASFEVAKAMLMAAYEHAGQQVQQYEATLRGIETNFDLATIEYKAMAQAVEAEITAVRIEIEAARMIGDAEELLKLAAELEAATKSIELILSRIPIAEAEIQKTYAEMEVLRAEQALAVFKDLTAHASMDKSETRRSEIATTRAKIAMQLEEVGLRIAMDEAQTDAKLSEINAKMVEEELDNARSQLQILNINLDALLAGIRKQMADADTSTTDSLRSQTAANAQERVAEYMTRISQALNDYSSMAGKLATMMTLMRSEYTTWTADSSLATLDKKQAMIDAANAAANADVNSTFVYKKGTGAAP